MVSPEVDANLATMENLAGQMQPPDLSQMPGSSAGSPMYILDAAPDRVRKVEIVGGKIDNVGEVGAIKGQVDVKQVGTVEVTQAGEFVMRLSSGETIPVYVEGGQVQANLSPGGIDTLTRAIDQANVVQSQLGFVSGS